MPKNAKVVLLCGNSDGAWMIYNGIRNHCEISAIISVKRSSRWSLFRRRTKKLGWKMSIGQLFFVFYLKLFSWGEASRRRQLIQQLGLNPAEPVDQTRFHAESVNSELVVTTINQIEPDYVLVYGTAIIKKNILSRINAKIVNIHAGITPKYRGVHGGYWALANDDADNFGVTLHYVDAGIDTGEIISQARTKPVSGRFNLYVYEQIQLAIPMVIDFFTTGNSDNRKVNSQTPVQSKLWSHPTLAEYLRNWIRLGIR
jgi:phosphoribosylglycinamide formyltransferase-1